MLIIEMESFSSFQYVSKVQCCKYNRINLYTIPKCLIINIINISYITLQ